MMYAIPCAPLLASQATSERRIPSKCLKERTASARSATWVPRTMPSTLGARFYAAKMTKNRRERGEIVGKSMSRSHFHPSTLGSARRGSRERGEPARGRLLRCRGAAVHGHLRGSLCWSCQGVAWKGEETTLRPTIYLIFT